MHNINSVCLLRISLNLKLKGIVFNQFYLQYVDITMFYIYFPNGWIWLKIIIIACKILFILVLDLVSLIDQSILPVRRQYSGSGSQKKTYFMTKQTLWWIYFVRPPKQYTRHLTYKCHIFIRLFVCAVLRKYLQVPYMYTW